MTNFHRAPIAVAMSVVMLLSSCATKVRPISAVETAPAAEQADVVVTPVTQKGSQPRLARRVSALIMKSEIRLGPQDVLEIKVKDHPELTSTATVDPWGFIKVPYIRGLQINGLTEDMVEDILTQKYAEFFRAPPEVEVNVVQYNSQVVYVLGAVENPGRYQLVQGKPMTLRDVIVGAGLPTPQAALWRVWVIRQTPEGGSTLTHVNFYRILYRGQLQNNIELQAGDIVYLPMGILDSIVAFFARVLSPFLGVARRAAATSTTGTTTTNVVR